MFNRSAAALLAALALPAAPALAEGDATGAWVGRYVCGQGITDLTLVVQDDGAGALRAVFDFRADPLNPGVPEGCFEMSGRRDPAGGTVSLSAGRWLLHPDGYVTVGLDGGMGGDTFIGQVHGPFCSSFTLTRQAGAADALNPACRSPSRLLSAR